jgi:hypothetical protein
MGYYVNYPRPDGMGLPASSTRLVPFLLRKVTEVFDVHRRKFGLHQSYLHHIYLEADKKFSIRGLSIPSVTEGDLRPFQTPES